MNNKPFKNLSKISKKVSSDTFMSIHLLHSRKGLSDIYTNLCLATELIPQNSNNEDRFKKLLKNNQFQQFTSKFKSFHNKTTKTKNGKISNFEKFINNSKNRIFHKFFGNIRINDFAKHLPTQFNHKKLFNILIDDELLEQYKYNLTDLRKDVAFCTLLKMINFCDDDQKVILTKYLVKTVLGLSHHDIKTRCKQYGLKRIIRNRKLGHLEKYDMELNSTLTNQGNYIRIGYSIIEDDNSINEALNILLSKLQNKINFKKISLITLKYRFEKNQKYYSQKDYEKDCKRCSIEHPETIRNFRYVGHGLYYAAYSLYEKRIKARDYVLMIDEGCRKQFSNIRKTFIDELSSFKKKFVNKYLNMLFNKFALSI